MRTIRTKVYQFSELTETAKQKTIGLTVTYSFPGLMLVSAAGTTQGKIIRLSTKRSNVLVEDIAIEPGETKLYQHWICADQITSEFKADGTRF